MFLVFKKTKTYFDGSNCPGFTLLEITAVLGIIGVTLLGVSSLILQSLRVKQVHQNYVTASMLAQEGVELVRNQRDSNWLDTLSADWKFGSGGLLGPQDIVQLGVYSIDKDGVINGSVSDLDDPDTQLYFDGSFYTHTIGGASTPFRRIIEVINNNTDIEILCRVRWQDQSGFHYYDINAKLYDWR